MFDPLKRRAKVRDKQGENLIESNTLVGFKSFTFYYTKDSFILDKQGLI